MDEKYLRKIEKLIKKQKKFKKIHFEYLTDTLKLIGIFENPYSIVSLENTNDDVLKNIVKMSFEKINTLNLNKRIKNKLFLLWDYLAKGDKIKKADIIFVFGGKSINRVKEAVKLYKKGFAKKILFSGGTSIYIKNDKITEAEYYAQIAKEYNIPEKDLILETLSTNTPENVINSISLLKKLNFLPKRIILITVSYHMLRAYLTFKSAADWNPALIRHPVPSEKFKKENYFKDINGWSYVFFEYIKLWIARLMKHF
jgi:hypothetical protein